MRSRFLLHRHPSKRSASPGTPGAVLGGALQAALWLMALRFVTPSAWLLGLALAVGGELLHSESSESEIGGEESGDEEPDDEDEPQHHPSSAPHFRPTWMVPLLLLAAGLFCLSFRLLWPVGALFVGSALIYWVVAASRDEQRDERQRADNERADAAFASLSRGTTRLRAALGARNSGPEHLLELIRSTAQEALGAQEVFVVLDDETGFDLDLDPRAHFGARCAQQRGAPWLWPLQWGAPVSDLGHPPGPGETLLAAPLPNFVALDSAGFSSSHTATGEKNAPTPRFCGALVAIGRCDGGHFSARDALILENLTENAALALENWQTASQLRGQIENAGRELSDAYQLLSEQNAKLFAAMESIDAALVVCDHRGHAAFVNPASAKVLRGATPILGEPVVSALTAGDLEEFAALFEDLERSGLETEKKRVEAERGGEILAAQFTPLVSEEGQMLGAMLVVSNLSAQRELDRMKTNFVGYVAHELRTPLTTILGYASLIDVAAGRFSIEQTREMTAIISRHCRRMNRLISDFLDLTRLENGLPLPLHASVFDLAELCERVLDEQRLYLNDPEHQDLRFDCPQRPLEWHGDPDRIEQIIINLISNAVKYSPDGGKITLHLSCEASRNSGKGVKPQVRLEMRDEGIGLSAEQISRLFQKFYRTPDARARGIKGTGLGLTLVREIVAAHGGTIEVFSPRDIGGVGATFRILLPAQIPTVPPRPRAAPEHAE